MAKRVFFSFHYEDVIDFRANVVRLHNITKNDHGGYFDGSIWENAKTKGVSAVKELIDEGLKNTTVTVVLIGSETYSRRWVRYEIMKSMYKGNKIIGIHINNIAGKDQKTKKLGPNPFSYLGYKFSNDGTNLYLFEAEQGQWVKYKDYDTYNPKNIASEEKRGKFYNLNEIATVYDWINDDGFNKFSNWIS